MKIVKKLITFSMCAALVFSLCACQSSDSKKNADKRVTEAIELVSAFWNDTYIENRIEDKHLEICNTRIINIKDNDNELFSNVDYIVEFTLMSNFYNSAPYYDNLGTYDTVIVYKDGKTEVSRNLFTIYRATEYVSDYSDIIESIEDFRGEYDKVINIE